MAQPPGGPLAQPLIIYKDAPARTPPRSGNVSAFKSETVSTNGPSAAPTNGASGRIFVPAIPRGESVNGDFFTIAEATTVRITVQRIAVLSGDVRMDPFVEVRYGERGVRTGVLRNGGREATWNEELEAMELERGQDLTCVVKDLDKGKGGAAASSELVGKARPIRLEALRRDGRGVWEDALDLFQAGRKGDQPCGKLFLRISFDQPRRRPAKGGDAEGDLADGRQSTMGRLFLRMTSVASGLGSDVTPVIDFSLVRQAACWMQEAQQGVFREDCCQVITDNGVNLEARCCFRTGYQIEIYKHQARWSGLFSLCNVIYLSLTVFEAPNWCGDVCPDDQDIPRMPGTPNESHAVLWLAELGMLSVYVFWMWATVQAFPHARSEEYGIWRKLQVVMVSLAFFDIVVISTLFGNQLQIHQLLRVPIFISFTTGIRNTLTRVIKSLPHLRVIASSLVVMVVFFSWAGMVLFGFTDAEKHWASLPSAMKHMYIMTTTNNMPGIMLSTIKVRPMAGLFCTVYLLVVLFLGMNILLATMYDGYKMQFEESIVMFYKSRRRSIKVAYAMLDEAAGGGEDGIDLPMLEAFLGELLGTSAQAAPIMNMLDTDGSGRIEEEEFQLMAEVLSDPHFRPVPHPGGLKCLKPYEGLSDNLDVAANYLSLVAAALVLWQTTDFAAAESEALGVGLLCLESSWTNTVLFVISIVYAVELGIELPMKGRAKFFSSQPFQNSYDLVTVCMLIPLELAFYFGFSTGTDLCRILTLLRGSRWFRCVDKYPGPRELLIKTHHAMDAFGRVMVLLFCCCYFGAQLGIITMGGRVSRANPSLVSSKYAGQDFWLLNFNDFPSALFLFWSHIVGNNANIWLDSFTNAFGTWVWFGFFLFDIVVNIILMNILIALVIDSMMVPMPEPQQRPTNPVATASFVSLEEGAALLDGDDFRSFGDKCRVQDGAFVPGPRGALEINGPGPPMLRICEPLPGDALSVSLWEDAGGEAPEHYVLSCGGRPNDTHTFWFGHGGGEGAVAFCVFGEVGAAHVPGGLVRGFNHHVFTFSAEGMRWYINAVEIQCVRKPWKGTGGCDFLIGNRGGDLAKGGKAKYKNVMVFNYALDEPAIASLMVYGSNYVPSNEAEDFEWPDTEDQLRKMFANSGHEELKELSALQAAWRKSLREMFSAGG